MSARVAKPRPTKARSPGVGDGVLGACVGAWAVCSRPCQENDAPRERLGCGRASQALRTWFCRRARNCALWVADGPRVDRIE